MCNRLIYEGRWITKTNREMRKGLLAARAEPAVSAWPDGRVELRLGRQVLTQRSASVGGPAWCHGGWLVS